MGAVYESGGLILVSGGGVFALPASTPPVTGFNPPWPRVAAMRFQQNTYTTVPYFNDPAYISWINCRCLWGVGLNYTGNAPNSFGAGGKGSWVSARKASTLVPGGNRIVQYTEPMTYFGTNPTGGAVRTNVGQLYSYMDTNKTLYNTAYNAGTYPGTVLGNGTSGSSPIPYPNISTYGPNDTNGLKFEQFFANYSYQAFVQGTGTYALTPGDAASAFDGFYHDDIWYCPDRGGDGDINRDGTTDTGISTVYTNGTTGLPLMANNWRAGEALFYTQMETLMPGFYRMANADYASHLLNHGITNSAASIGAMNGILDAAQLQSYLGWGFTEGDTTFLNLVTGIQLYQNMLRSGGIPCIDISFLSGVGTPSFGSIATGAAPLTWSADAPATYTAAYVGMRYYSGLIFCISNGALMCEGTTTGGVSQSAVVDIDSNLQTYDEWGDFSQSGSCFCGFMGLPVNDATGAIQTAPKYVVGTGTGIQKGIWERRFYNATTNRFWRAVANSRGNGAVTYLPTDASGNRITLWKMRGTQNTAYNNATSFSSLAMADPDGGIFCESAT